MYYNGKVNTKAGKQFIQLERPDRYHKIRDRRERRRPDAWTVFIEVLAIMLMVIVAIYILRITP